MSEQTTLAAQAEIQEQKQEVATQAQQPPQRMVTDFSLGIFGSSDNWNMAGAMAKQLAKSNLVPKEYQNNIANCIVAIDLAQRLGASPFLVMQNLDVIQGRPSWSSKALIGMINASGRYDFELQFDEKEKDGKPFSCQCWTEKKGRKVTGPVIDMNMAQAEGWLNKNGSKWKTMPQVMLRYRAASFFSRMNCPEIAMGLYTTDEIIETDFNDDPPEVVIAKTEMEIEQNQNSIPFDVED